MTLAFSKPLFIFAQMEANERESIKKPKKISITLAIEKADIMILMGMGKKTGLNYTDLIRLSIKKFISKNPKTPTHGTD